MNSMEQDMIMTIKHLTQLLEDARKDNHELREELNMVKGLLWMKQNGKDVSRYFNNPATGEEYNIDPSSVSHGGSVCDGGITYTDTHPLGTDRYSGN